jgi:hypothetical protein
MPEGTLRGRSRECAQIDALVQNAARGTGGSLIFRGEAGIGKTTLLDYAATVRTGVQVARNGLNREELAGGFGFPKAAALSSRLEDGFLRRVRQLPPPTCRLRHRHHRRRGQRLGALVEVLR